MTGKPKSSFAEISVEKLIIESFANEASAYFEDALSGAEGEWFDRFRSRLKWHIAHSLSNRQKQVIQLYLCGKTQREIGAVLGIKHQVAYMYKRRAINKLRRCLAN